MPRVRLFTKIVVLILVMLIPIVGLYFYSNKTSTDVIRNELNRTNANQLQFFQNQVDTIFDNLGLWPDLLMHDPDITGFKDFYIQDSYFSLDEISLVKRIETKLKIQESSSNWKTNLSVFAPLLHRMVNVNDAPYVRSSDYQAKIKPGWQVEKAGERFLFSRVSVYPYLAYEHPEQASLMIEVQFDSDNIQNLLDEFKRDGRRDPVFYRADEGVIYNRTADRSTVNQILKKLSTFNSSPSSDYTIQVGNQTYLVNIVASANTGWKLVDYIPLSDILQPIGTTNRIFYLAIACLLLMSFFASYLLYAQVQVPLKQLLQSFQKMKMGDYTVRLSASGRNEFNFVFHRFNTMAEQIQDLIEKVLMQRIHVKEARFKQLQSQINPHFLYNCFSFISSMAKLQNHRAVIAMAENLSRYFRYTTRQERELVQLSEEVAFITNYLDIQRMRMKRLCFTILIQEHMQALPIPPLLIQPLVENAVIHGVESGIQAGSIVITGTEDENGCKLTVEDDGRGMMEDELRSLRTQLLQPMDEATGCGLWNVQQRLQLRYGDDAGITLESSSLGGLKVTLIWSCRASHGDGRDGNL